MTSNLTGCLSISPQAGAVELHRVKHDPNLMGVVAFYHSLLGPLSCTENSVTSNIMGAVSFYHNLLRLWDAKFSEPGTSKVCRLVPAQNCVFF